MINPVKTAIPLDTARIEAFCEKWKVREFSLFGSVLRDDFRPDSDVDVLVDFEEDANFSLLDLVDMTDELEEYFDRQVHLTDLQSVKSSHNWIRKTVILDSAKCYYAKR